jgi:hypothetical protein
MCSYCGCESVDVVGRFMAEHVILDEMLARVRAGHHEMMPAFERVLRAHIDGEENGFFPTAAIAFAGPEWERVTTLTPPAPTSVPAA